MRLNLRMIFLLLVVLWGTSCKRFQNPFADQQVLAEAGKKTLYMHDIASMFTPDMLPEDSVKMIQSYVDQWVKQQLKIQEAERMFKSSQEDIDKKVEEYRNSLLTFKVDQYYVDQQIDTLFTPKELADYYLKNKQDFILDKTLLKARVVKFPPSYRQSAKLKELMLSPREDAYQDLVEISTKNKFELIELNNWSDLSALVALLPTDREKDYDYLLDDAKVFEFTDRDMNYYVRTVAYRRAGDYAPQESVTEVIKRVIFNQRKQQIIRAHEDSLYREALTNNKITVHAN